MRRPVRIVSHDPKWADHFVLEREQISRALGRQVSVIEHIGSTAVKGLAAKPIIDIMAGVTGPDAAEACLLPLEEIGYGSARDQPGISDWHYCIAKPGVDVSFHLHLVTHPSPHWDRHILFRDHLRTHPEAAEQYGALKVRLAREHTFDREAYTDAKTAFVRRIEELARREGGGTSSANTS